jgi:hypothetical protein
MLGLFCGFLATREADAVNPETLLMPGKVKLAQDCLSCHATDDVHLGQYGRQCDRCHSTTIWKGARVQ